MLQQVFYYCLKTAHQYKFDRIYAFLGQFDWALDMAKQNNDKDIFKNLLQKINETKFINMSLAGLLKNTASHEFDKIALECLYDQRANLTPQLIALAAQSKNNDDLLISIYNNDQLQADANQNSIFISRLISAIISKNNIHYINTLKKILMNINNKSLLLSAEELCTLYLYCIDYNLTHLQKKMENDESVIIQLLLNSRCNKPLFDKIIGSNQFFDYLKTQEVQLAFQTYIELNANTFSDDFLPRAHQLILHPNARTLLPPDFSEAIIRKTIQFSKKSPDTQSLKDFIFDIIECSYVSNFSVLTLKSLMHYCLIHQKLDTLFCLEKHDNFSSAFDQDIYIESFQLALKLFSHKHIENLAIHPFHYNLNFQDNFKLLCYFIKKNKCLNLFEKLFNEGFYSFLTQTDYQNIAKIMLTSTQSNIEDKGYISEFAQLFLSNFKVHSQKLGKFIDIRALIQDQQIYSFRLLGKHLDSLNRRIDLIKLIQAYPTTQIQSIIGLHFQLNQEIIEEIEKDNIKFLGEVESAQNQKLIHKSHKLFLQVEKAFQKKFDSYGDNQNNRIIAIEKEIKTKLLECIFSQAKEQKQNKIDINRQNAIIKYIDEHKESILSENELAMTGLRKILISSNNPTDITHFQTAWLSYDKGFVREELFERNWDNYRKFFVEPPEVFSNGGTYTAGEHSIFYTNKIASQEIRKRACYYWLLVNDPADPIIPKNTNSNEFALAQAHKNDVLNFRIGNFFGIISSIYRTNGFGISTCYPGHLTAIMNMGLQHTIGTPVDSIELIAHLSIPVIRDYIKNLMEESKTWDGETKAQKVDELLAFKPEHAKSLIIQNTLPNSKYHVFYKTVYSNIDKLKDLIWQSLPEDFIKEEDGRKINALIENAILGFSANPFIHDCIMEDILNSPCIIKDFNVENDNIYLLNTKSIKYLYFSEFYQCVFKNILNSSSTIMPTISQKGTIIKLLRKIVNELVDAQSEQSENKIQKAIDKLNEMSFSIPIKEVQQLVLEKKSLILLEKQIAPVIFSQIEKSDEIRQKPEAESIENKKKKSFS